MNSRLPFPFTLTFWLFIFLALGVGAWFVPTNFTSATETQFIELLNSKPFKVVVIFIISVAAIMVVTLVKKFKYSEQSLERKIREVNKLSKELAEIKDPVDSQKNYFLRLNRIYNDPHKFKFKIR